MVQYLGVASFSHPLYHLTKVRLQSQAHMVLLTFGRRAVFIFRGIWMPGPPGEYGTPKLLR